MDLSQCTVIVDKQGWIVSKMKTYAQARELEMVVDIESGMFTFLDMTSKEELATFGPVDVDDVLSGYKFINTNRFAYRKPDLVSLHTCLGMIPIIDSVRNFKAVVDTISIVTGTKYR